MTTGSTHYPKGCKGCRIPPWPPPAWSTLIKHHPSPPSSLAPGRTPSLPSSTLYGVPPCPPAAQQVNRQPEFTPPTAITCWCRATSPSNNLPTAAQPGTTAPCPTPLTPVTSSTAGWKVVEDPLV